MNAEKQIIGSLILDSSRIDDIKTINAEMFVDPILGEIFSLYANSDEKEVNQLTIAPKIKNSYLSEQQAIELMANLAIEHDPSISDASCEEIIFRNYRSRKINEMIDNQFITPENVDKFLDDICNVVESFQKHDEEDIKPLSELVSLRENYFNEKHIIEFQLGIESLDKALGGLDRGDVTIISARPSVGKSAFALQIGRKFGREGYKVGYFNLEMGNRQIYERAIASASGIDMTRIRLANNFLNDEELKFASGNERLLEEENFYVITGTQTIKKIRAIQKRYKFDVIIIDYLQLISPVISRNSTRASEVGEISRGLKTIALNFNIPVIALSQLNRDSEKLKDKEPSLADLRESGDIEQDASVVLMMWNSNPDDVSEKSIKAEKSRNGFKDKIKLIFDGKHMRFTEEGAETDFETTNGEDLPW